MTPKLKWGLCLVAILALTAALYLRSLGNAFVYDDLWMIRLNPYIKQWSFLWRSLTRDSRWFRDPNHLPQSSYYRPLQDIWFGLNYQLFGFNVAGWHAMSIMLHLVMVWLVYEDTLLLVSSESTGLIAALLFAVTPIHAEAVAWASAIPLLLVGIFILASFFFFLTRAEAPLRNWLLSLMFSGLGLLTHESAIVVPALIAAYAFLLEPPNEAGTAWIQRLSRTAREVWPFATLAAIYLVIRILVIGGLTYRHAQAVYASASVVFLTIPFDLFEFFKLLFSPWDAGAAHSLRYVTNWTSPRFWVIPLVAAIVAGTLTFAPRPRRSLIWFCLVWIFLSLAPELKLISGFPFSFVQDRYLYLASFGWCVLVADLITAVASRNAVLRTGAFATVALLAAIYAVALIRVQNVWHDDLTYFTDAVVRVPRAPYAHHGLCIALAARNRLPDALKECTTAVDLDPTGADWAFDRGVMEAHLGDYQGAVRDMTNAITLEPRRPAHDYATLAEYADAAGNPDLGERALARAASMTGGEKLAETTRAQIELRHGNFTAASQLLKRLIERYPDDALLWSYMGSARVGVGDYAGALDAYQKMAKLAPDFSAPYYLSAEVLHAMHRDDEALANCRIALKLTPDDPATLALLAAIQKSASTSR